MQDRFEPSLWLAYLRARWRLAALIPGAAAAAGLAISLLAIPLYTARVSLVIEPPVASDPRATISVSPVYLESLRTYEHFATSDELFSRAVEKFGLRREMAQQPVEKLKQKALSVSMPRNTKVLEIEVTLRDARKAHAMARFIAGETVALNRRMNRAGSDDLMAAAGREAAAAEHEYAQAARALQRMRARAPATAALEAELDRIADRRVEIDRLALSAELSMTDQEEREKELAAAGPERAFDLELLRGRLRSTQARASRLRQEASTLAAEWERRQKLLEQRRGDIEALAAEAETTRNAMERAQQRLRDLRGATDFRSERISLLDPGIVPERPSWPNPAFNVLSGAALGSLTALAWLTVSFALKSQQSGPVRRLPRAVGQR